jgi:hypothetical protein
MSFQQFSQFQRQPLRVSSASLFQGTDFETLALAGQGDASSQTARFDSHNQHA